MSTGPAIVERPKHRRKILLREVMRRTGLGRSTVYEKMEEGLFPQQAKAPGTRTAMWWEDEIDDWNASPAETRAPRVKPGKPPARPREEVSAGVATSQPSLELRSTSPRKQVSKRQPSGEMSGLERTGITLLGREVYRHVATNRLLLDVGLLLAASVTPVDTDESKTIQ